MARQLDLQSATALGRTRDLTWWGKATLRLIRKKPLGALGAFLVVGSIMAALLAPVIAPYDPVEFLPGRQFQSPGFENWLGTDNFGRDVLSRVLYGARVSLYIGIMAVAIGVTAGTLLGLMAGFWAGSAWDTALQRVADALMAFPTLILALIVSVSLGASVNAVIIAISLAYAPDSQRVIRSAALAVRDAQYVEAARAVGCLNRRILFRHIMPQCVAPYLIIATAMIGQAIIVESAISFVGAGPPPPTPTWGNMLSDAVRFYAARAPWLVIFPGAAICLSVYGFNLLGDAVRDILDPRLRGR